MGALSADELAALYAAAASDEQIRMELTAFEATVAELARVIPSHNINRGRSAGIRARLVSRAAVSREGRSGMSRSRDIHSEMRPLEGSALDAHPLETRSRNEGGRPETAQSSPKLVGAMASITQSSATVRPTIRPATSSVLNTRRQRFNWLALAAGIVLVAVGAELAHVVEDRNQLRTAVANRDAVLLRQVATLQASVAAKDSMITALTGPNMKVVDLVNYASQDPVARMFWDRKTQEWTMYAYNLRQPKPGKTFQVWLITNTSPKPISAGTFTPDAHGAAVMHAKYPMERQALARVAVSEEPAGGMPAPTGPIIVAGVGR